jgi:hypothetical protein
MKCRRLECFITAVLTEQTTISTYSYTPETDQWLVASCFETQVPDNLILEHSLADKAAYPVRKTCQEA